MNCHNSTVIVLFFINMLFIVKIKSLQVTPKCVYSDTMVIMPTKLWQSVSNKQCFITSVNVFKVFSSTLRAT